MGTWYSPETSVLPASAGAIYDSLLHENHILIGGTTGSGKSVLLNGLIYQAMRYFPQDGPGGRVQFIFIDPKRIELSDYKNLPHTISYAYEIEACVALLESACKIMDERYAETEKARSNGEQRDKYYHGSDLYIIIDELADMTARGGTIKKRTVQAIQRLCQLGRAAKVHVIACTQRPTEKVIPHEITDNMDARIGLRVEDKRESRNILRYDVCATLPKHGCAYIKTPSLMQPQKITVPMLSDDAIMERVQWWVKQKEAFEKEKREQIAAREQEQQEQLGFWEKIFGKKERKPKKIDYTKIMMEEHKEWERENASWINAQRRYRAMREGKILLC